MRYGPARRYRALQRPSQVAVRRLIPFELGGLALLLALGGLWVLAGRRVRRLAIAQTTTHGGARWATWRDIKGRRARAGHLVLGTLRQGWGQRAAIGVSPAGLAEGVLINTPSGLGKSNSFYKPPLLEADPDVDYVVTDPKGETWDQTAGALSRTHDCYRLDMLDPHKSVTWAPLAQVRTVTDADTWAQAWLANTNTEGAPSHPFFTLVARLLVSAAITHVHAVAHAAGRPSGTLDELTELLLRPSVDDMERELRGGPGGAATGPAQQFLKVIAEHRDMRATIPAEFAPRFGVLNDPGVRAVVAGGGALDLDRLGRPGQRPMALYIVIPPGREKILQPLIAGLFTTLFTTLLDRARTLPGQRLEREVRLLLDEFGTIGRLPGAPAWFNVCRQARISRVVSCQSISQLEEYYGQAGRQAIVDSCATLAWLGGTRGDDAEWCSRLIGQRTVLQRTEGDSTPRTLFRRTRPDRGSRSVSETGVPLLFPSDLRESPRSRVVVVAREGRPMDLTARPYWGVTRLRRLAALATPQPFPSVSVEGTPPEIQTGGTSKVEATPAPAAAPVRALAGGRPVRVGKPLDWTHLP